MSRGGAWAGRAGRPAGSPRGGRGSRGGGGRFGDGVTPRPARRHREEGAEDVAAMTERLKRKGEAARRGAGAAGTGGSERAEQFLAPEGEKKRKSKKSRVD